MSDSIMLPERITASDFIVCLLGNGASMEGLTVDGEPFPSFLKIIDDVIKDNYLVVNKDHRKTNDSEKFNQFANLITHLGDNSSVYLKSFIDGVPGTCHYHFLSLLFGYLQSGFDFKRRLVIVTTNFDDFLEQTFETLEIEYQLISLEKDKDIGQEQHNILLEHSNSRTPIVLHLFGDIKGNSPLFFQQELSLTDKNRGVIKNLLDNLIVSIGYSFSDKIIYDLTCGSDSRQPIFNASPSSIDNGRESGNPRKIYNFNEKFHSFTINTLSEFYRKSVFSKENKRYKRFSLVLEKYEEKIKSIPPTLAYDEKFIRWKIDQLNDTALKKIESRFNLTKEDDSFSDIYVTRDIIDWHHFSCCSEKKILAILGNAGIGKSSYLYMTAKKRLTPENIHFLLIKSTSIDKIGLQSYLEKKFLCAPNKLEELFFHMSKELEKTGKTLIILIDAINELGGFSCFVKNEIEEIFSNCGSNIKCVYTCRTYFWKSNLELDGLPASLYYPTQVIKKFTNEQLYNAYEKYKRMFNFSGNLNSTTIDFRERLKDPLMLSLLAVSYADSAIPSFAPAVKIFEKYQTNLKNDYKKITGKNLENFFFELGKTYWQAESSLLTGSMSLPSSTVEMLCDAGEIEFLMDNNVIYTENGCIQFSYERFFEFILGNYLILLKKWNHPSLQITSVEIFDIWKECLDLKRPYTYLFSLKSSLVHLSHGGVFRKKEIINNKDLILELLGYKVFDGSLDKNLISQFRLFSLDFIKETITEINSNSNPEEGLKNLGYENLRKVLDQEFYNVLLDIGRDDFKSIPYQTELIARENIETKRQVAFNFLYLCNDKEHFKAIHESSVKILNSIDQGSIEGLIYILPVLIKYHKEISESFGFSALRFTNILIKDTKENLSNKALSIDFQNKFIERFRETYKREGNYFFGSGCPFYDAVGYAWSMGEKEKEFAFVLVNHFMMASSNAINSNEIEALRFFASQIEKYEDIDKNFTGFDDVKKMRSWEYFIARYTLTIKSKKYFHKTIEILDYFLEKNLWLTFDFCMCTMEGILRNVYVDNDEYYSLGIEKMEEWSSRAERNFNSFFYCRLSVEDPLNYSFNPLSPLANVVVEKFPQMGFDRLNKRLSSGITNQAKLALLSVRKVSRKFPIAGEESLIIAWKNKEKYDSEYKNWLHLFIKELSFTNPKMIYNLFISLDLSSSERSTIESIEASPRTNEYNINSFFQYMLFDEDFMRLMIETYREMLVSTDLDTFFSQNVRLFFSH